MAGGPRALLTTATLVACSLLLLLVHFELRAAVPSTYAFGIDYGATDLKPTLLPPLPPPPPARFVEPICQVTFGRAVCVRGAATVTCPDMVDLVRHDTKALGTGAWVLSPTYICACCLFFMPCCQSHTAHPTEWRLPILR